MIINNLWATLTALTKMNIQRSSFQSPVLPPFVQDDV